MAPQSSTPDVATDPRTWIHRMLVASIVALTATLVMWTAGNARAVEEMMDDAGAPRYHSVRQLEQEEARRTEALQRRDADELHRLDQIENRRLGNHANATSARPWRPSERYLLWLEYSELRRFRNRAPAWGHAALDAEIERLRAALADATP